MIAPIGSKPIRVAHNVGEIKPDVLIVLEQRQGGWNKDNPDYLHVLQMFYDSAPVRRHLAATQRTLETRYVQSLTDEESLFVSLFWLLDEHKRATSVSLDVTAMPRQAESVAITVASLFPNARCWASGKRGYGEYSSKRYPNPEEEGSEPFEMLFLKRDIANLRNNESPEWKVFRCMYVETLRNDPQGESKKSPFEIHKSDLVRHLASSTPGLDGQKVSRCLATLKKEGLVIETGPSNFALHKFARKLAEILTDQEPMERDDPALIEKFVDSNDAIIRQEAERFRTYRDASEERIRKWLGQFPSVRTAKIALKLLQNVEYISNQDIREYLEKFFENKTDVRLPGTWVVVMGRLADSGDLVANSLTHQVGGLERRVRQLGDTLTQKIVDKIYAFDDSIITGTQSVDIFSEWLGLSPTQKYVVKLDAKKIERLKSIPIEYHVIVGSDEGASKVAKLFHEKRLKVEISESRQITRKTHSCFSQEKLFEGFSLKERPIIKKEFKKLGMKILSHRAQLEGWTREKLEERALGYSDWQLLLVFQHNTPTTTLPIFWEKLGSVDGKEWLPLFPRMPADST